MMKDKYLFLAVMAFSVCCTACGDDTNTGSGTKKPGQQENAQTDDCRDGEMLCDNKCVDLDAMNWKKCGVCRTGYEDRDGDAQNGCEHAAGKPAEKCRAGEITCGGTCTNLSAKHWYDCNVCLKGYEDKDGSAENGCEAAVPYVPKCKDGEILCGSRCTDLAANNWSECGVCLEGFENADGSSVNGCEADACADGLTRCGEECVDLKSRNWRACDVCLKGWLDGDGDPSNGCEVQKCPEGLVICDAECVDLKARNWTDCGVCAEGYVNADGNQKNGCEAKAMADGKCTTAADCRNLYETAKADCQNGKCAVVSCADGFADCDADPRNGCETNTAADYYKCGARGTCTADAETDPNYKGRKCALGEQCSDGTCRPVPEIVGCSDGTREGFADLIRFNNLAACGGAWTVPGIHHDEGPACSRQSGNTGTNREGKGCNLEDLCAEGWHVCLGRGDVMTRSEYGCDGILDHNPNEPALFITRTSSTGSLQCDPDTVGVPLNMNDIFGCGNFGCLAGGSKCPPLTVSSHNLCDALRIDCGCRKNGDGSISCNNQSYGACFGGKYGHSIDYFRLLNGKNYQPAWDCGSDMSGEYEARDIIKSNPDEQGGVMCCKDQCRKDADCGAGLICRYHVCVECIINKDNQTEGCPDGKTCSQNHTCI